MQHLNVKLFAQPDAQLPAPEAIAVFHRWIQRKALPELLIDVADYSHVPAGPGVVLIGHQAAYSLDNARNRLGVLYNRIAPTDVGPQASLKQAYESAHSAVLLLESEPEFQGRFAFDSDEVEIVWNDRLLYPNTADTWADLQPEIVAFFDELFGPGHYTLARTTNSRERLRVNAKRN